MIIRKMKRSPSRIHQILHSENEKEEMKTNKDQLSEEFVAYVHKRQKKLQTMIFSDSIHRNYVVQAFMFPAVNSSLEPFGWGEIDFSALQSFCQARDGLDVHKLMRMIQPAVSNQKRDKQVK